ALQKNLSHFCWRSLLSGKRSEAGCSSRSSAFLVTPISCGRKISNNFIDRPFPRTNRTLHQSEKFRARFCSRPVHSAMRSRQMRSERHPVSRAEQGGITAAAVIGAQPIGDV